MNTVAQLSTEDEIQSAYQGRDFAAGYVEKRFVSEVQGLLHEKQVKAVQTVMSTDEPKAALEIAPGPGRVTRDVCPHAELTALEFNEGMIEEAKAACSHPVNWVQGNAFELPFDQGNFDFVYTFRFIRHFHRDDRFRLYEQIQAVLKPGGCVVFDAVNKIQSEPLRNANPDAYPIYDKLYLRDELIAELKEAGFVNIQLQPVQKRFALQAKCQVLVGPRWNWLNRVIIRALETLPKRDGLEWIVKCQRA